MHKIAAGPPAHEYGSEVHLHMIVYSPVVRACIGTKGAVGIIGPDHGGNSIHNVGFSGVTQATATRLTTSCSQMFCSFPYCKW